MAVGEMTPGVGAPGVAQPGSPFSWGNRAIAANQPAATDNRAVYVYNK
ncbi:hypothetical protein [Caballeronia grimmiae]